MPYPVIPQQSPGIQAPADGQKATYAAAIVGLVSVASATDIFTITGSATKIVRVTKLRISGVQTTGGDIDIQLVKRSTANSGGTSTTPAIIPYNSNDPTPTTVVNAYTANPASLGTSVGVLAVDKLFVAVSTAATGMLEHTFGNRPAHAIVLNSASEVISVNLNGVTVTGGAFDIWAEWTEE